MRTKITRALLSVYDKTGIVEFAHDIRISFEVKLALAGP